MEKEGELEQRPEKWPKIPDRDTDEKTILSIPRELKGKVSSCSL